MALAEMILKIIGQDSSAGALGSASGNLNKLDDAAGKASTNTGGLTTKLGGLATVAGGFIVAHGILSLPGLLKEGALGAAEDEAAMMRLTTAIDNTGSSSEDYGGQIDDLISKGEDLAFSDGEIADALGTLVSLTGSTEEGMGRLQATMDLARGANISLEAAARLLGKQNEENTVGLRKLGIELEDGAGATEALAAVNEKFGGQAVSYAQSSAGEYAKFNIMLMELQETVGAALIPIFMALAPVMELVVPIIEAVAGGLATMTSNTPGLIALGLVLAVIFLPLTGAVLGFLAIAAAIGVVVFAVYTFRDEIMGVINFVIDWITGHWQILAIALGGPIGAAVVLIIEHWDAIMGVFQGAWDFVSGLLSASWSTITALVQAPIDAAAAAVDAAWQAISGFFNAAWDTISGLLSGSWATVTSLVQVPIDAAAAAVDAAWQAITGFFDAAWGVISGLLSGAWSTVTDLLMLPVEAAKLAIDLHWLAIRTIFETAWGIISGLLTTGWSTAQSLLETPVQAAHNTIDFLLDNVVAFFSELPTRITDAVGDLTTLLTDKGSDLIAGLLGGVEDAWGGLYGAVTWFIGLGTKVVQAVGDTIGYLYSAGVNLIQGLKNGVLSMAQSLLDAVADVITAPVDWAEGFLGIGSPSRLFESIGVDVMQGLINGLQSKQGEVWDVIGRTAAGMAVQMGGFAGGGSYRAGIYQTSGLAAPFGPGLQPLNPILGLPNRGPIYLVMPDGRVLAEVVEAESGRTARSQGLLRPL